MKLGEALTLRARQAQKLNDLQGRIKASAIVQEDTEPPEDAYKLIDAYLTLSEAHEDLVSSIQETNAETVVAFEGVHVSITNLLQQREGMIRERNIYGIAARTASPGIDMFRYARSELKQVPQVNVAELREKEDTMSEMIRALDAKIQQINWETDLYEGEPSAPPVA